MSNVISDDQKNPSNSDQELPSKHEPDEVNSAQPDPSAPPDPTSYNSSHNGEDVDARTRANRENAQHSTGPRTPAGRAASSRNALKHGLFVEDLTELFRTDDEAQRYQRFIDGIIKDIDPVGDFETVLARRAADIQFRLDMLRNAEFKVYSGAGLTKDSMEGLLHKSGDPMGLASLYDARFQRNFNKTMDELHRLQKARREKEVKAIEELKAIAIAHIQQEATFDPGKFGFVISRDLVFSKAHLARAKRLTDMATGHGVMEKKVVDYVAQVPPKAA